MTTQVSYKDDRDITQVYCGLRLVGTIERVGGGWSYFTINKAHSGGEPVFPSRKLCKDSLTFTRAAKPEG